MSQLFILQIPGGGVSNTAFTPVPAVGCDGVPSALAAAAVQSWGPSPTSTAGRGTIPRVLRKMMQVGCSPYVSLNGGSAVEGSLMYLSHFSLLKSWGWHFHSEGACKQLLLPCPSYLCLPSLSTQVRAAQIVPLQSAALNISFWTTLQQN